MKIALIILAAAANVAILVLKAIGDAQKASS